MLCVLAIVWARGVSTSSAPCMTMRGVEAAGTRTVTSRMYGRLRQNAASCDEFLALAGLRR